MVWRTGYLDVVLVLCGLSIMSAYHVFLIYRIIKHPETTVIGYENHNKRAWVKKMLEVESKDRNFAVSVINGTISAATFLASTSLALCSVIGGWMGSSSNIILKSSLIYGNTSDTIISVKYACLLIYFLVAFSAFLQCARNFVNANFFISMPKTDIPVEYVQNAVIRGSICWLVGLRAIYFATTLLLWFFGPIPMFACSVIMVIVLHFLDTNNTPLCAFDPPAKNSI